MSAALVLGGCGALWFASSLSVDQRLAAISEVLTFGALLFAGLAAVVAIAAYRFTQRRPRMGIDLVWDTIKETIAQGNDSSTALITISPQITNFGTAPARNVRVTLFFFDAAVLKAGGWQYLGTTGIWCEIATLHVDHTIPTMLPPLVIRTASSGGAAKLSWQAVADRAHDSGQYVLNPLDAAVAQGTSEPLL